MNPTVAPNTSGAHLFPLPSNRTDSVIKSSLRVIRKGERRREGGNCGERSPQTRTDEETQIRAINDHGCIRRK